MKNEINDILEYTIALVSDFAEQFELTPKQAFQYINFHEGIDFIEQHYGVMHTLDFREAVESLRIYCQKKGGKI